jgi:hypothetical protein
MYNHAQLHITIFYQRVLVTAVTIISVHYVGLLYTFAQLIVQKYQSIVLIN